MKLCWNNQIADNTEPSRRKPEGVETMHLPTRQPRVEDIVRSARRRADSGRNDLSILLWDVAFTVPQRLGDIQAANLFRSRVLVTSKMGISQKLAQQCNLLALTGRQDTAIQDVKYAKNVSLLHNRPLKHGHAASLRTNNGMEKVPAKALPKVSENGGIIVAKTDADLGTKQDKFAAFVWYYAKKTLAPKESAEFGFPQFVQTHSRTSNGHSITHRVCDKQEGNSKDTMYDLGSDTNITNVWNYGGAGAKQGDIFNASFKDLPFGVRLYESTIVPISRASGYGDVYNTFVLGAEAYGTIKLDTMPAKIITHMPGSSGVSDPLDQVATVGWKANHVAVILNNSNFVVIKHQASTYTGTRAGL